MHSTARQALVPDEDGEAIGESDLRAAVRLRLLGLGQNGLAILGDIDSRVRRQVQPRRLHRSDHAQAQLAQH